MKMDSAGLSNSSSWQSLQAAKSGFPTKSHHSGLTFLYTYHILYVALLFPAAHLGYKSSDGRQQALQFFVNHPPPQHLAEL